MSGGASDPVEVQVARIRWRLDALDTWRNELDARMAVMESKVNDLRFTDAVADALAKKIDARNSALALTVMQKVGAGLFALILVALPVAIEKLT